MNVNIGGGAGWNHSGWLNLDQQGGFRFTPSVTFPMTDRSAPIVYSSHCLEHLDDVTVDRVLSEARRICSGNLVLKLPDFEEVLRRWDKGDAEYFQHWGMNGVAKTWRSMGVEDTIDTRASMIFCGWWNDAYGNEWGQRNPDAHGAYHGPARAGVWSHQAALRAGIEQGPHWLSETLRDSVPEDAHMNHQNAWSRKELRELLKRHGFAVSSTDRLAAFDFPIPGIRDQEGISMYAVAG